MKLYSLALIRNAFIKKAEELNSDKKIIESVKDSVTDFLKVKSLLNSKLFKKVYVSYSNYFYFDQNGFNLINSLLMEKHSLSIELKSGFIEHFVISDFEDMPSAIQKIKYHLKNPENRSKMDNKKEERKEQNKIRVDFDNYFNSPIPKNIENKKILSIDFEYDQNKDFLLFECGITLFQNGKFEYQHYLIEENYTKKGKLRYNNQFKFNFGKSKKVPLADFLKIIAFHIDDSEYILGHSIKNEYYILKHYGIDFAETDIVPIDSQKIFYCNFRNELKHKNVSLETLLQTLDISHENLHNAGNDAAYTMQSVLKMHDVIHGKSRIQNISYSPKKAKRFKHA